MASARSPMWCRRQAQGSAADRRERLCGPLSLFERSYPVRGTWPVLDTIDVVMESVPGTCDIYTDPRTCCTIGITDAPEHAVIASFLDGCHRRKCRAMDLGANAGWMTTQMLWHGAAVVAVEPQPDLASAINDTVRLNCWEHRALVLNARACELSAGKARSQQCLRARPLSGNGWRLGGVPKPAFEAMRRSSIRGVALQDLIFASTQMEPHVMPLSATSRSATRSAHATSVGHWQQLGQQLLAPVHIDLIKMDGDGPEGSWLRGLDRLISHGQCTVGAVVVEGNRLRESTLARFQSVHRFVIYRIDNGFDKRRFITPEGWDAFSPLGTIAPLGRLRGPLARDRLETEILSARAIRHLFRIHDNLSEPQWSVHGTPTTRANCQAQRCTLAIPGSCGFAPC